MQKRDKPLCVVLRRQTTHRVSSLQCLVSVLEPFDDRELSEGIDYTEQIRLSLPGKVDSSVLGVVLTVQYALQELSRIIQDLANQQRVIINRALGQHLSILSQNLHQSRPVSVCAEFSRNNFNQVQIAHMLDKIIVFERCFQIFVVFGRLIVIQEGATERAAFQIVFYADFVRLEHVFHHN